MFWAKSREIVEVGEAGKEPEGLRSKRRKAGQGEEEEERVWKKPCKRTHWAGQQEEGLHLRTFWPKQPLTPRSGKLRPLRRALGGGEEAWQVRGGAPRRTWRLSRAGAGGSAR